MLFLVESVRKQRKRKPVENIRRAAWIVKAEMRQIALDGGGVLVEASLHSLREFERGLQARRKYECRESKPSYRPSQRRPH
jgi:hypothetical protein